MATATAPINTSSSKKYSISEEDIKFLHSPKMLANVVNHRRLVASGVVRDLGPRKRRGQ